MVARSSSLVLVATLLAQLACQQPPPGQVYAHEDAPADAPERKREFTMAAHREAYEALKTDAIEPLRRGDPIAAAQLRSPAPTRPLALPPLALVDRNALLDALAPVWARVGEIDEAALAPDEVVGLRTIRFGLGRIHDELHRRPQLRSDPLTSVRALERLVDELELRLLAGPCADCEAALAQLDDTLTSAHQQLGASSQPSAALAKTRASLVAARLRRLALPERAAALGLTSGSVERAAAAIEAHVQRLDALVLHLPSATALAWSTQAPPVVGGPESIQRLPAELGERTLTRLLSAEERLDTPVGQLWAQIKQHASRWQRMRETLVEPTLAPEPAAAPLDVARCEATRERLAAAFAGVPELALAPPQLDCTRFVAVYGGVDRRESELVLALLDAGWIEPDRRSLRSRELLAIALIEGQWSAAVHRHLRRVMLLAAIRSEPHALALALDEGRRALCLAATATWVHAELGPVEETRMMQGDACEALLPEWSELLALVHGDPRGALAGLGLSLIGDEPAAMAGFERFWWAPLGLMRLLATPPGMHPDTFALPSEQAGSSGEVEVEIQPLDPMELPDE